MGLHFKLGRANVNKTKHINQLLFDLINDHEIDRVFYLVPDNLKFEAELSVLKDMKEQKQTSTAGMIDLQVYSFTRLAWHLLSDSKIFNQTRLSQTGLAILAKKIMLDLQESDKDIFKVFRGQEQFGGFLSNLTTVMMELRKSLLMPEDIDQIISQIDQENDTNQKLKDLNLIYSRFLNELSNKYLDQEDILRALVNHFNENDFSRTAIVIDHFENFSGQELELIESLLNNTKNVYISLTLDKAYPNNRPELIDLFYLPGKTYHTLFKLAQANELDISTEVVGFDDGLNEIHQDLLSLEDYWLHAYTGSKSSVKKSLDSQPSRIQIAELLTVQDEINYVSNRIRSLIAEKHLRFKDILVVSRNLEDYHNIVKPIFGQSDIPVFFNLKETMSHHPLVEFIMSLLGIIKNNFQYEDVMRFLRSELYVPEDEDLNSWRHKVDLTENVLLAYGYRGAAWTRGEEWVYRRFDHDDQDQLSVTDQEIERAANEVRSKLSNLIMPLKKSLTTEEKSTGVAIQELYRFIEQCGVKKRILNWRDRAIENDRIEDSNEHEQAWNTFISIIDEYIEVLADAKWSLDEFMSIIETAFENTEFSIVPPTIDQVTVTKMNHIPIKKFKVVFYIGMNSSNLPLNQENNSILDDQDRNSIQELLYGETKKGLPPSTTENLATEPFNAYVSFGLATQYAYFTYAIKQDGSNDEKLSPYLMQIKEALNIPIYRQEKVEHSLQTKDLSEIELLVGSYNQMLVLLIHALRIQKEFNSDLHPFWKELMTLLVDINGGKSQFVLSSLTYKNIPVPLSKQMAEDLYGKNLYLSVSRLETFYKDPYYHFLKYGLGLEERKELELTPAESGSFYHDIFDQVFKISLEKNLEIGDLTPAEINELSHQVLESLIKEPKYRVLTTTQQMNFISRILLATAQKKLQASVRQIKHSKMEPKFTEVHFGFAHTNNSLPALKIPIDKESVINLRGKIDRIDLMTIEDHGKVEYYLQVVDYKSSEKSLDFKELDAGLALQLLTYFDVALTYGPKILLDNPNQQELKPLAALFSTIQNSKLKKYDGSNENSESEIQKLLKYNGLLVNVPESIRLLDTSLTKENSGTSINYPIRLTSNDKLSFSGNNKDFVDPEDLVLIFKNNRLLIKQAGLEILSGNLSMRPYHSDQVRYIETVSGQYLAISQFDITLPENNYRYLPSTFTQKDFIDKLRAKFIDNIGDETDD